MAGTTIGKSLNYGFAGEYARQPDMIISTFPNDDTTNIVFGMPVMYSNATQINGVVNVDASLTADKFVGVAAAAVKSNLSYVDQNEGGAYAPKEATSVFERGSISVLCVVGAPQRGGEVYVRTVAAGQNIVGQFEATADSGNNILIENAQWGGPKDNRNVAELVLLTRKNA